MNAAAQLALATEVMRLEAAGLLAVAARLDHRFCQAVQHVYHCRGSVLATGMGKAGLIAQKIAATLASTGTRSHFVHPADAVHGDLGRIRADDVLLVLSQSGETEEIVRLLPVVSEWGVPLLALTGRSTSALGRSATVTIELGRLQEACPLRLAPTTSTAAMLAVGDALALVVSRLRGFRAEDFHRYHPGGSLGRKLRRVQDAMRPLAECRVVPTTMTVREVYARRRMPGRRTGATLVVDADGRLCGIFTDSDLARLFERRRDAALDGPIADVMTREPALIELGAPLSEALALLSQRKISELPVVDRRGRPVGLLDLTDLGAEALPSAAEAVPPMPKFLRVVRAESAASPTGDADPDSTVRARPPSAERVPEQP